MRDTREDTNEHSVDMNDQELLDEVRDELGEDDYGSRKTYEQSEANVTFTLPELVRISDDCFRCPICLDLLTDTVAAMKLRAVASGARVQELEAQIESLNRTYGKLGEQLVEKSKKEANWNAEKQDYERRLEEMSSSCDELREKLDNAHDYMDSERLRADVSSARVMELEDQVELLNEKLLNESVDRSIDNENLEAQFQAMKSELEYETQDWELEKQKLELLVQDLKEQLDDELCDWELEKRELVDQIEDLKQELGESSARVVKQQTWEAEKEDYASCLEESLASIEKLRKQLDEQQASMETERMRAEEAALRIKELEGEIELLSGKIDGESSARTRDQMVWEAAKEDYDRRLEEMMRKEETMSELLSHTSNSNNMVVTAVTSTEDDEGLLEENVERTSTNEGNWQQRSEYRPQETVLPFSSFEFFDFDERWRGPFGVRQMQEWYRKGYFPGDLEIRIDGTKLFVYTVAQLIARNGRECPFVFLK